MKIGKKMDNLKKFEDHLIDTPQIIRFGEYRRGSGEYGTFIQDLMMFLRNFRKDNEDNLIFRVKDVKFDLEKLHKLVNDENKSRLISFSISFTNKNGDITDNIDMDGNIVFSDLNKKDDRPWEKFNYE